MWEVVSTELVVMLVLGVVEQMVEPEILVITSKWSMSSNDSMPIPMPQVDELLERLGSAKFLLSILDQGVLAYTPNPDVPREDGLPYAMQFIPVCHHAVWTA